MLLPWPETHPTGELDGTRWDELPATPWAPRHTASVFVHEDALWVVAGNNMTPDVWKLIRVARSQKKAVIAEGRRDQYRKR